MNDTTKMPQSMIDALYQLTGDESATLFMKDIWYLSQIWDDFVDGEQYKDMDEVFMTVLVRIPQNSFYRRHMLSLTPVIHQCIMDWKTANLLEQRQQGEDLNRAYMLRASPYRLFHYCLSLIHGEQASELGVELWSIYGETLDDYLLEMKHA